MADFFDVHVGDLGLPLQTPPGRNFHLSSPTDSAAAAGYSSNESTGGNDGDDLAGAGEQSEAAPMQVSS